MHIHDIQEQARELRDKNNWEGITMEQRMLFLVSEVGELTREVLNMIGLYGEVDQESTKEKIGMEIYDIVLNLCEVGNLYGINLEEIFEKKYKINLERRWE